MKMNYKKGFSLIEILISLIIISLIVGAFSPLITKKLKANDVTVGSFEDPDIIRRKYCNKFDAVYIPASMNDGVKPVCVTKYNVGDMGIPIADGVQVLNVGKTCTDSGNCCWQGQTSPVGSCTEVGNRDSEYSGCTRTICNWAAAYKSCTQYAPTGTYAGSWRLPTIKELEGWNKYINELSVNRGKKGLQLCSRDITQNSMRCAYFRNKCLGSYNDACMANGIWSSDAHPSISNSYLNFRFDSGTNRFVENDVKFTMSGRCVLDIFADESDFEDIKPEIKTREPTGQPDCDKYNALYIEKAKNGGKTAVCAMKYNIGDVYTDPIVRVVSGGTTCHGKYCCWQGTTTSDCTDDGNYSGCSRTVCNWDASNISCNTYAPDGIKGLWRLPTKEEMEGWANNLNNLQFNKGKDGLMLCDAYPSEKGSVRCTRLENSCPGSASNNCYLYYIWSYTEESSGKYYYRALSKDGFHPGECHYSHGISARCVTDKIPVK